MYIPEVSSLVSLTKHQGQDEVLSNVDDTMDDIAQLWPTMANVGQRSIQTHVDGSQKGSICNLDNAWLIASPPNLCRLTIETGDKYPRNSSLSAVQYLTPQTHARGQCRQYQGQLYINQV